MKSLGLSLVYLLLLLLVVGRGKSIWYCDLKESYNHGCPACWLERLLVTVLVIAPTLYSLVHF